MRTRTLFCLIALVSLTQAEDFVDPDIDSPQVIAQTEVTESEEPPTIQGSPSDDIIHGFGMPSNEDTQRDMTQQDMTQQDMTQQEEDMFNEDAFEEEYSMEGQEETNTNDADEDATTNSDARVEIQAVRYDMKIDEAVADLDRIVPAMSPEEVRSIIRNDNVDNVPYAHKVALISAAMAFAVGDTVPAVTRVMEETTPKTPSLFGFPLPASPFPLPASPFPDINDIFGQFQAAQDMFEEWQKVFTAPRRHLKFADDLDMTQKRDIFRWFAAEVDKVKGDVDKLESLVVRLFDDILDRGVNLPMLEGASWTVEGMSESRSRKLSAKDTEEKFIANVRVGSNTLKQEMKDDRRFLREIPSEYIAASRVFLRSLPQTAQVTLMDNLLKMSPNSNDGDFLNYISKHQIPESDQAATLFLFRFSRALAASDKGQKKQAPMPDSPQRHSPVIQPTNKPSASTRAAVKSPQLTAVNSLIASPAVETAKYLRGMLTPPVNQPKIERPPLPMFLAPFFFQPPAILRSTASLDPTASQIEEDIKHTLKLPLRFVNDMAKNF